METKSMRDIVGEWLKQNGYDGLAGNECGCELGDLMCCDEPRADCVAGHKITCPCSRADAEGGCEYEGFNNHWCIMAGKKE